MRQFELTCETPCLDVFVPLSEICLLRERPLMLCGDGGTHIGMQTGLRIHATAGMPGPDSCRDR